MINIDMGKAGATFRHPVTDTAAGFDTNDLKVDGTDAKAVLVTCEGANVRYAFGGTEPTQGPAGVGHLLQEGEGVRWSNLNNLASVRLINAETGQAAVLQVTPEADI